MTNRDLKPGWQDLAKSLTCVRLRMQARREGKPLPPPEDVIKRAREERLARLTDQR